MLTVRKHLGADLNRVKRGKSVTLTPETNQESFYSTEAVTHLSLRAVSHIKTC